MMTNQLDSLALDLALLDPESLHALAQILSRDYEYRAAAMDLALRSAYLENFNKQLDLHPITA